MSLLSRWMERIGLFRDGETDRLEAERASAPAVEERSESDPLPLDLPEDKDAGLFVDPAFTGEHPVEADVRVPFPGDDPTDGAGSGEAVAVKSGSAEPGDAAAPPVGIPDNGGVLRVSLAELLAEHLARDAEERELTLVREAGLEVGWDDIFEAGGLPPSDEGFTVEHVARIIEANPGLEPLAVRTLLLEGMARAGTHPKAVLGDALGRDEALDVYERILQQSVRATTDRVQEDIRRLEGHIAQLEAQIVERQGQQRAIEARLSDWREDKRDLERRWQAALVFLVKRGEDVPRLD